MLSKRRRIFAVTAVILIFSIVVLAAAITHAKIEENFKNRVFANLQSFTSSQGKHIQAVVNQQYQPLLFLADLIKSQDDFSDENNQRVLNSLIETNRICMLGFADANGYAVGYNGNSLGNISERRFFSGIVDSGHESCVEYLPSTLLTSEPRVLFSIPLYDNSTLCGVIFSAKEVSVLENALLDDPNFNSNTKIYIVDSGLNILFANPAAYEIERSDSFANAYSSLGLSGIAEEELLQNHSGIYTVVSKDQSDSVFVNYSPIGINDWYLVCAIDRTDATDNYYDSLVNIKKAFMVFSLTFAGVLLYLLAYSLIETISHKKTNTGLIHDQRFLSEALTSAYSLCIRTDLKENNYRILDDSRYLLNNRKRSGTIDELIDFLSSNIPDESDKKAFLTTFSRDAQLVAFKRGDKMISLRHRLRADGDSIHWVDTLVVFLQDRGIICGMLLARNADRDQCQIEKLKESIHRAEIYYDALLTDTCASMEVNLSTGIILERPEQIIFNNNEKLSFSLISDYSQYDAFENCIMEKYLVSDKTTFSHFSDRKHLLKLFNNGNKYAELSYKIEFPDKSVRDIRNSYYMFRRENNGDVIAICAIYDITDLVKRDTEIKNLKSELEEIRIKVSTGQMNPHFLYNALGSIREIIIEDPQYASDLICDFTAHLRACVRAISSGDPVPFQNELDNVKAYVNIEKMRFGDKLKVEYDIQVDNFLVVPLGIQPIVENAIKYGIFPKGKTGGTVKLSTRKTEDGYMITVVDNGVGFDYAKLKEEVSSGERDSTGLTNMIFRFEKRLDAKISIESRIGSGTSVSITIPKNKGCNNL